jgi:hypothetical protein
VRVTEAAAMGIGEMSIDNFSDDYLQVAPGHWGRRVTRLKEKEGKKKDTRICMYLYVPEANERMCFGVLTVRAVPEKAP